MKYIYLISAACFGLGALALAGPHNSQTAQAANLDVAPAPSKIAYPTTVVELFTSQGCSSCPPANKLVREIADTDNLLALSYSVDYWDYLGWKDTLGRSEFSERQRTYGKKQFQGQVYTPQIILNGATHAARFAPTDMLGHTLKPTPVDVELEKTAEGLKVRAAGEAGTLVEVRFVPGPQSVAVARGENRGRTITLANVVTSVKTLGSWRNNGGFTAALEAPDTGEAVAILLQDGKGGPILTAATYSP